MSEKPVKINLTPYYQFFDQLLKGEAHIAYREDPTIQMQEGRLIKSDETQPKDGLRIIQLHGSQDEKPQLEGNPTNSALIVPGGLNVAVPIHDRKNNKIHYAVITIPVYMIEGYRKDGSPIIAEGMIEWEKINL